MLGGFHGVGASRYFSRQGKDEGVCDGGKDVPGTVDVENASRNL